MTSEPPVPPLRRDASVADPDAARTSDSTGRGEELAGAVPTPPEPEPSGGAVHVGQRPATVLPFRERDRGPIDDVVDEQPAEESQEPPFADAQAPATTTEHERTQGVDWAWVEEWRAGREPVPWGPGLAVAAFTALVVGAAVWVLTAGLIDRIVFAILVNLVVAGGLAPAMWLSRDLPVLRWVAAGGVIGLIGGWIAAILLLSVS